MEKRDFRRERLAALGLEHLQKQPGRGWPSLSRRAGDVWRRSLAFSGLEKAFFLSACVLVAAIVIGGLVMVVRAGSGGDNAPASAAGRSREDAPRVVASQPSPTAIVVAVPDLPTLAPTEEPTEEPPDEPENRRDCDAIRGTPYRSDEERDWFNANCGASVSNPPASNGGNSPPPPPQAPTPPPTDDPSLSAGDAIAVAVSWMTTSAPKAYTVDSSTCSAVRIGDHWVVTCEARLLACTTSACLRSLQVCVFEDPVAVVPADRC